MCGYGHAGRCLYTSGPCPLASRAREDDQFGIEACRVCFPTSRSDALSSFVGNRGEASFDEEKPRCIPNFRRGFSTREFMLSAAVASRRSSVELSEASSSLVEGSAHGEGSSRPMLVYAVLTGPVPTGGSRVGKRGLEPTMYRTARDAFMLKHLVCAGQGNAVIF